MQNKRARKLKKLMELLIDNFWKIDSKINIKNSLDKKLKLRT
jgi:hypothetical protein